MKKKSAGINRRKFLKYSAASSAALGAFSLSGLPGGPAAGEDRLPLGGTWRFRTDPQGRGEAEGWQQAGQAADAAWSEDAVPHTWKVAEETADYLGQAWYRKEFDAPSEWRDCTVRLEFEAVYHTATIWFNGQSVGSHTGKGYTAFIIDISAALLPGERNFLVVRVDNSFDKNILPRGDSYDWAADGGIIRPVSLLVTGRTFIERVEVDAVPDLQGGRADLDFRVILHNSGDQAAGLDVGYRVIEEASGLIVLQKSPAASVSLEPGMTREVALPHTVLPYPKLWHFDHPNLYHLEVEIRSDSRKLHSQAAVFGIRTFEVRDCGFYLNGERVRLMGVERMGGSHPDFGMAEPVDWIEHDHRDLKELNCVFTRVHWPQDSRVLDFCDRHGILIQLEVPAWGPETFQGMKNEPDKNVMQNGLEQLREMIARDRNHPCIFAWGVANEIDGQNPAAFNFARRMSEEAARLDPRRLRTYASNSLLETPGKDVSGLMDFIEFNEYYESWVPGTVADMRKNLEAIHSAFPDKPLVISEYGYCQCRPDRTGGDPRLIEIMRTHNAVFRECDFIGGAIFFCYNDYRTHIGDKGQGALKQRVHGVVDLYGEHKPSYEALRQESSPLESLEISGSAGALKATLVLRASLPSYRLEGYSLRWIAYGNPDLPMEQHAASLPTLEPGASASLELPCALEKPSRLRVDVLRPTGYSAATAWWKA